MHVLLVLLFLAAVPHQEAHPVLEIGVTLKGTIEKTDSIIESATLEKHTGKSPARGDRYLIRIKEAGACTIDIRSLFFDTYLVLRDESGKVLAEDDNGFYGKNSRIIFQATGEIERYLLDACAVQGGQGVYELTLTGGRKPDLSPMEESTLQIRDGRDRIRILEEREGENNPALARALNELAMLLCMQSKCKDAEPLLARALSIQETVLGIEHLDTAETIGNQALIYCYLTRYDKAKPLLEQALEIKEKLLGTDDPGIVTTLNHLARLHYALERTEEAKSLYDRALKVQEKHLPPEHTDIATTLYYLAELLRYQSRYDEAESHLCRALLIMEKSPDSDESLMASMLDELARVFKKQGKYEQAGPLLERALRIQESFYGASHPCIASTLDIMAGLRQAQCRYEEAESLFRRALLINEEHYGAEHFNTASASNNLALLLYILGEYDEAEPLLRRALLFKKRNFGFNSETAKTINNLALLLDARGKYHEAKSLYAHALEIQNARLGSNHPETARIRSNLAGLLYDLGEYDQAIPLLEKALDIRMAVLGPSHPETADSLGNLATLLWTQGRYDEVKPLLENAIHIKEAVHGSDSPDTAMVLFALAGLLDKQGQYEEAGKLYDKVLQIWEAAYGPEHPRTAETIHSQGLLLSNLGKYEEAGSLFERALRIREKKLGPGHPDTATTQNSLAISFLYRGAYVEARPLFERALRTWEKTLGLEHPNAAVAFNGLASLLKDQGNFEEARLLFERALAVREKTLGKGHPDTAATLNNLANLFEIQGMDAAAGPLYERALRIYESALGSEHPITALTLYNLAKLFTAQGRYEKAENYYERALGIYESTLRPDHPKTATILHGLAMLHSIRGDFEEARDLYERALRIKKKAFHEYHPEVVSTLYRMAELYLDQGERALAWKHAEQAMAFSEKHMTQLLWSLTESERLKYADQKREMLNLLLTIARAYATADRDRDAYEVLLRWKGVVFRSLLKSRDLLTRSLNPEGREILVRLESVKAMLSKVLYRKDILSERVRRESLDLLNKQHAELEAELTRHAGKVKHEAPVSLGDCKAALPEASAFIDFYVHRWHETARNEEGKAHGARERNAPHLSVWIQRKDEDYPVHLDLGPAKTIQETVRAFSNVLAISKGFTPSEKNTEEPDHLKASNLALRNLLWAPIAQHLDGVRKIFISPDLLVGGLPFEAIQLENNTFLIEHYIINYFQDMVSFVKARKKAKAGVARSNKKERVRPGLLLVGDVDYGKPVDTLIIRTDGSSGSRKAWEPLSETGLELAAIAELHEDFYKESGNRYVLNGANATEKRIKAALPEYEIVHIATHGFFEPKWLPSLWLQWRDYDAPIQGTNERDRLFPGLPPGFLSGLVLAGANDPHSGSWEDGLLTAEEISWIDLSKVYLAVLSACESGLGRPSSGEGMLGLGRTLRQEGADNVIASLWRVNDQATRHLFTKFYRYLWKDGMKPADALRRVKLDMIHGQAAHDESGIERGGVERRAIPKDYSHPYFWAAFICWGD